MTAPTAGRWLFSVTGQRVVLSLNDGVNPVATPQGGAFNIEVFTNPTVSGVPNPDSGFQSSFADAGGTLDNGFLTGAHLRLGNGDFLVVDSFTGAVRLPSKITLGNGNQTVVGASFDTLIGGVGAQILSALAAFETVVGGLGNQSIWGGLNDSIVAGSGQVVVTGPGTTVVAGIGAEVTIAAGAQGTILASPGSTGDIAIAGGNQDLIDLTGNSGVAAVIGGNHNTVTGGSGTTNIEGAVGGMLIKIGTGGVTNVSGSTNALAGNTITGGAGGFDFNPGATAGKGDVIDLSGGTGTATVNAFAFGATRIASPDTILGSNSANSAFGGDGDRIGTASGPVVGGTHQWVHADTAAGSAVGFGSNHTVASTTYDTVAGTATRGTVAGTSSAQVTVGGFTATTDFIFYQNETAQTTSAILATSQATNLGGTPSTIITLPDGTLMTLVGVTQAQLGPGLFKP